MVENNILEVLERRVYQALKKIAEQQQMINTLIHEKQQAEQALSEKDEEIEQLKRDLLNAEESHDAAALEQYQEREQRLKERIQELVDKIDKVRLLE